MKQKPDIPFNKPYLTGRELSNISKAYDNCELAGDGSFTMHCQQWLEEKTTACKALITHSCTAALEMAAHLAEIKPGDEIIMPSYTFVSTANAFVLREGVPVFVDVRPDTLNIDETLIEDAITPKTKAIVPVHYAGVGCEMDSILEIAQRHSLMVIEDTAQGILASYKGRKLGSMGIMGALSFHATKNITSGEGGALLINNPALVERAEIIREKGTNRKQFIKGQIDKYTWTDKGSSFLPGEIIAAFLMGQFEEAELIINKRIDLWQQYHEAFNAIEKVSKVRRPIIPKHCNHNAHIYYLLLSSMKERDLFIKHMKEKRIQCATHYVPLHNSPAGKKYCRTHGDLNVTDEVSKSLVRMPLYIDLNIDLVINTANKFFQ